MPTVRGSIRLRGDGARGGTAAVYVRLLNTSRADASSETVAEFVLPDVDVADAARRGLSFELAVPADAIDPNDRYEISVLVDCDGDGEIGSGDYYSTVAYPVITRGAPSAIAVDASRIE